MFYAKMFEEVFFSLSFLYLWVDVRLFNKNVLKKLNRYILIGILAVECVNQLKLYWLSYF